MGKGPGRNHRRGITLPELMDRFPDDATAEQWFAKQRWGHPMKPDAPPRPACPHCGSFNVQSKAKHKSMPYRCRERECRKRFSVRTGTVMECSKLGYRVWALAIYLLTTGIKGTSSMKLHRDLGITQKSAWHLAHRIRETWGRSHSPFEGPVEADETFVGGKRCRGDWDWDQPLRPKTVVAGVKDRATNTIVAKVVPDTKARMLSPFVMQHTMPGVQVYTDEAGGYVRVPNRKAVRHSVARYVDGEAHTNGLESFWSLLKRGYHGTFHHVSPKHLDRYVKEFAGRYNQRDADTIEQMQMMARGLMRRRLPYEKLISGGPAYPKR